MQRRRHNQRVAEQAFIDHLDAVRWAAWPSVDPILVEGLQGCACWQVCGDNRIPFLTIRPPAWRLHYRGQAWLTFSYALMKAGRNLSDNANDNMTAETLAKLRRQIDELEQLAAQHGAAGGPHQA